MSLVTVEIKYTSGKIGKLITLDTDLFDILYVLEKSNIVEKFSTDACNHKSYGRFWKKWSIPETDKKTRKLYVVLVKKDDFPPNIVLGDNWRENGDDFCFSSFVKEELVNSTRQLNLSEEKLLYKEFDIG